jgi:hypothetical protein
MRLDGRFWGDAVSGVQPFRREDLVLEGVRVLGKGRGVRDERRRGYRYRSARRGVCLE